MAYIHFCARESIAADRHGNGTDTVDGLGDDAGVCRST